LGLDCPTTREHIEAAERTTWSLGNRKVVIRLLAALA